MINWEYAPEKLLDNGSHAAGRRPAVLCGGKRIALIDRQTDTPGRCEIAEQHAIWIASVPIMLAALTEIQSLLYSAGNATMAEKDHCIRKAFGVAYAAIFNAEIGRVA